jgi:hypothetical protein
MTRIPLRALLLVVPLCGALLVTAFARTSAPQDPKPPEGRDGKGEPPQGGPERPRGPRGERGAPNLHNSMEQLQRTMDQVLTTIGDPAKSEETLVGLGRMVQFAGSSVTGQPKNLAEQPEDKRAAHKNAFRRETLMLTRQLVDIELLVLDGKHTEAADLLKKLPATRDAAHEKFGGDEDKGAKDGEKPAPGGPPKK